MSKPTISLILPTEKPVLTQLLCAVNTDIKQIITVVLPVFCLKTRLI
ncbi:MAG: hypothetical protein ACLR56_01645 [Oscillospiraceae bacterium]